MYFLIRLKFVIMKDETQDSYARAQCHPIDQKKDFVRTLFSHLIIFWDVYLDKILFYILL